MNIRSVRLLSSPLHVGQSAPGAQSDRNDINSAALSYFSYFRNNCCCDS